MLPPGRGGRQEKKPFPKCAPSITDFRRTQWRILGKTDSLRSSTVPSLRNELADPPHVCPSGHSDPLPPVSP